MLTKNELMGAVIWPLLSKASDESSISVVNGDGEVLGNYFVTEPVRGDVLTRWVPDGCTVLLDHCTVSRMTGPLRVTTSMPFDTSVNVERPQITVEDRLIRLERLTSVAQKRALRAEKERDDALDLIDEYDKAPVDVVPSEPDKPQEAEPEPPEKGDSPTGEGGPADA